MAKAAGKDSAFKIDNSASPKVLTDLTTYITEISGFEQVVASLDTTTMGNDSRTRIGGLEDCSFGISGVWDDATLDLTLSGIVGLIGSFEYGPEGSTVDDVKYYGECLCTGYEIASPVDGLVTYTASFVADGDVTRGAFS